MSSAKKKKKDKLLFSSKNKPEVKTSRSPHYLIVSFLLSLFFILCFVYFGLNMVRTNQVSVNLDIRDFLGFKELIPTPPPYPVNKNYYPLPELSASSVIILDVDSMACLYEKNPRQRMSPASTTKVMTALVALEHYPLDKTITVPNLKVDGNLINLVAGEELMVESLLYGLLVGSGNDAAVALAENYPGGFTAFIEAMNKKALELNLENTHFVNSAGLDQESHFSTAKDLALLSISAMKNPTFAKIVSTSETVMTDVTGTHIHNLKNTNELIGKVEGVRGVKTGWTQNAGECLISFVEREGHKVIVVVLGSQNRFAESQNLIDWVFKNFEWRTIAPTSYH
jgi:D-alanyl-D-alanine carboxypeptidase (penicillin-binding protein 5/6)